MLSLACYGAYTPARNSIHANRMINLSAGSKRRDPLALRSGFEFIDGVRQPIKRTQQIAVAFLPVGHRGGFPAEDFGGEPGHGEIRPEMVGGLVQRLIARTVRVAHRCHQE